MSFLLDTDIISQVTKPVPDRRTMRWLAAALPGNLYLSVGSLIELRTGVGMMAAGKRRTAMAAWLDREVPAKFQDRLLPVTVEIARECGVLIAEARRTGFNAETVDALIAATAVVHQLRVVTLNRKHFERFPVRLVSLGA